MMRCRSLAEMPVHRVEISKIARNHMVWISATRDRAVRALPEQQLE
jgi:hypothetical protein